MDRTSSRNLRIVNAEHLDKLHEILGDLKNAVVTQDPATIEYHLISDIMNQKIVNDSLKLHMVRNVLGDPQSDQKEACHT